MAQREHHWFAGSDDKELDDGPANLDRALRFHGAPAHQMHAERDLS
jgi:hypothetical protein